MHDPIARGMMVVCATSKGVVTAAATIDVTAPQIAARDGWSGWSALSPSHRFAEWYSGYCSIEKGRSRASVALQLE